MCGFAGAGQGAMMNEEWLFHSKEVQRSHVPVKLCSPCCSELTLRVMAYFLKNLKIHNASDQISAQLRNLGLI